MKTVKQIEKEKQLIARCESSLALERLKKRKADTRRKIELGGLVIKSGIDIYDKPTILGMMIHASNLIASDNHFLTLFQSIGEKNFLS